jgi:hypothetical protein
MNRQVPSWNSASRIPQSGASERVPTTVYPYSAGILGGLWGGLVMIPVALSYGLMSGHGIWYPVNLIAATLIRSWQQVTPELIAQFSLEGLAVGLAIHVAMSVGLGLVFAVLLPTLPGRPQYWAFLVGPILWFGAVYAGLPLLNPIMARNIDLASFAVANILYSLVLGSWVARTPRVPSETGLRSHAK